MADVDALPLSVWGVLNVTPDSFSDGGLHHTHDAAVHHGLELVRDGASVVDVGGESTRPGAGRVDAAEEQRRVLPVVESLAAQGVCISIDTTRASTAYAAVKAGARIINDVSGGRADPEVLSVAAESGSELVLMHWRAASDVMDDHASYDDVVSDVVREVDLTVQRAVDAGVALSKIIVDPGLGFAKNPDHNWELMRRLGEFTSSFARQGVRTLVGSSRKRFLAHALQELSVPDSTSTRDVATAVTSSLAAGAGAWGVRVHDVAATRAALAVTNYSTTMAGTVRPPMTITLTGLEAIGHHGVFEHEKRDGQTFLVDVTLTADVARAADTDDLAHTVDYGQVAAVCERHITGPAYDLIERVADLIAADVLALSPRILDVRVVVHKPGAPIPATFHDVSVQAERARR